MARYHGKYYISIFVNQPTWEDIDKWVESFRDLTGIDPDDDPKAEMEIDIWNNIQQKFRIMKLYNSEEEAYLMKNTLEKALGGASYKVRERRTREKVS